MATPSPSPIGFGPITKSVPLADNNGAVDLALISSIFPTSPFVVPAGNKVADVTVKAGIPSLTFGPVSFAISGSAAVTLSAFADLTGAVGAVSDVAGGADEFPQFDSIAAKAGFMVLVANYNASGSGGGKVALAPTVGANFKADGKTAGLFAVVKRISAGSTWDSAFEQFFRAWRLPTQAPDHPLEDGTYIIAEVDGSIAANLAITYGQDFTFIRKINSSFLKGDIGLKLQAGLEASLDFSATGRYLVAVSCGDDPTLNRLQIFKRRQLGFGFAVNAGVTANAITPQLPSNFNDLIGAVLGTDASQILQQISRWCDPSADIASLFAGATTQYLQDFLTQVVNSPDLQKGREVLKSLLDQWNNLPHTAATTIWDFIGKKVPVDQLSSIASQISKLNSADDLAKFIDSKIDAFLPGSPILRWAESVIEGPVTTALANSTAFKKLVSAADTTSQILDGKLLQQSLQNLQKFIEAKIDWTTIQSLADGNLPANFDPWLKSRLAAFLDKPQGQIIATDIQKLRTAINTILTTLNSKYGEFVKAIGQKYTASFNASYERSTTKDSLLDADFTLNLADGTPDINSRNLMRNALSGKFDCLYKPTADLHVRRASMTLGLQRHTHVEVSLPYLTSTWDHITDATSGWATNGSGQIVAFTFNANDEDKSTLSRRSSTVARDSVLTMTGYLNLLSSKVATASSVAGSDKDLNVYSPDSLRFAYSFEYQNNTSSSADLDSQAAPMMLSYFQQTQTSEWAWESALEQCAGGASSALGKLLLRARASTSIPVDVWTQQINGPAKQKISRALQQQLRQLVNFYYFSDLGNYKSANLAYEIMLYASLPVIAAFKIDPNGVPIENPTGDPYWDLGGIGPTANIDALVALVNNLGTAARFNHLQSQGQQRLRSANDGHDAEFFDPDPQQTQQKLQQVVSNFKDVTKTVLGKMLFWEQNVVHKVCDAAQKLSDATQALSRGLDKSTADKTLTTLRDSSAEFVQAFNANLSNLAVGKMLEPLGTLVIASASQGLSPNADVSIAAALEVAILKSSANFPASSDLVNINDCLIHQILTSRAS